MNLNERQESTKGHTTNCEHIRRARFDSCLTIKEWNPKTMVKYLSGSLDTATQGT